jgi:hypothetical protein
MGIYTRGWKNNILEILKTWDVNMDCIHLAQDTTSSWKQGNVPSGYVKGGEIP